jgi:hypothetical protein
MKNKTAAQSWCTIRPKATRCQLGPLAKMAWPTQLGCGAVRALGVVTAHGARWWCGQLWLPGGQDVTGAAVTASVGDGGPA